jgi:hypothetical protein
MKRRSGDIRKTERGEGRNRGECQVDTPEAVVQNEASVYELA